MSALTIKQGRVTLIYSGSWLALQVDGKCFTGLNLSDDDKIKLEAALRNSRIRARRSTCAASRSTG